MRLIDIEVDEISLVDKGANKRVFSIMKNDDQAAEAEKLAREKAQADEKAALEKLGLEMDKLLTALNGKSGK